jgi:hypothetical protein
MKNTSKLLGITVLIAVIGFSMAGCPNDGSDTESGTVTANSSGEIIFSYDADEYYLFDSCSIKTDLPEPDNIFSINKGEKREISGLQENQVVKWKAVIKRGALTWSSYSSGSEVRLYGFMHE